MAFAACWTMQLCVHHVRGLGSTATLFTATSEWLVLVELSARHVARWRAATADGAERGGGRDRRPWMDGLSHGVGAVRTLAAPSEESSAWFEPAGRNQSTGTALREPSVSTGQRSAHAQGPSAARALVRWECLMR